MRTQAEQSGSPLLAVAGPYEFIPTDRAAARASADTAKALAAGLARLPYDAGLALPEESAWLAASGAALPPFFRVASERLAFEVLNLGNVRVGLLLFPTIDPDLAKVPRVVGRAVADKARLLRERSDLVIGVSPWGVNAEMDFLDSYGHTVDVLLGSGPGPGFPARPMAGDKTLWLRPYAQGRALHVLTFSALPQRTPDWKWVRDKNASVVLQSLGESITNDPGMEALLAGFRLDQPAQ